MYKIIRKKSKNATNTARTVHLWDNYKNDTLCGMKKSHGLKAEKYWFSEVKNLPKDLCTFCAAKQLANEVEQERLLSKSTVQENLVDVLQESVYTPYIDSPNKRRTACPN